MMAMVMARRTTADITGGRKRGDKKPVSVDGRTPKTLCRKKARFNGDINVNDHFPKFVTASHKINTQQQDEDDKKGHQ